MEASLSKNSFASYHKVFSQVIPKEAAQDIVVPDTMPDAAHILTVCGNLLIRSKDVSDGRIRVEANIPARIVYRTEDSQVPRCLDADLPVSFSAEEEAVADGCRCQVRLCLKALDARILNPRKLTVKAIVEATMECFAAEERSFLISDGNGPEFLHVQARDTEISKVSDVAEKTFVITDEFILPQGATPMEMILDQMAGLSVSELKAVGNKLILKGEAHSHLIYCSPEGTIDTVEFTTDFSQIIDTDGEADGVRAFTELLLSGMYYDIAPGFDGRSLKMELHAVAQVTLFRKETVHYIGDAYSNRYTLELNEARVETETLDRELTLHNAVQARIELTEPVTEVSSCCAELISAVEEGGSVHLQIFTALCCKNSDGETQILRKMLQSEIPAELKDGEKLLVSAGNVSEHYAAPAGNGIELRMTVEVSGTAVQHSTFRCIAGIEFDESAARDLSGEPSLVMMKLRSDEDLWKVARENLSEVRTIMEVNRMEELTPPWEKLLLIPRTD